MKSDSYGPFGKKLGAIIDGDISIVHADFKPEGALTKAFSAPVTEVRLIPTTTSRLFVENPS